MSRPETSSNLIPFLMGILYMHLAFAEAYRPNLDLVYSMRTVHLLCVCAWVLHVLVASRLAHSPHLLFSFFSLSFCFSYPFFNRAMLWRPPGPWACMYSMDTSSCLISVRWSSPDRVCKSFFGRGLGGWVARALNTYLVHTEITTTTTTTTTADVLPLALALALALALPPRSVEKKKLGSTLLGGIASYRIPLSNPAANAIPCPYH